MRSLFKSKACAQRLSLLKPSKWLRQPDGKEIKTNWVWVDGGGGGAEQCFLCGCMVVTIHVPEISWEWWNLVFSSFFCEGQISPQPLQVFMSPALLLLYPAGWCWGAGRRKPRSGSNPNTATPIFLFFSRLFQKHKKTSRLPTPWGFSLHPQKPQAPTGMGWPTRPPSPSHQALLHRDAEHHKLHPGWGVRCERCLLSLPKMLHQPGFEVQECRYTGQFVKKHLLSIVTESPLIAEF